MFQIITEHSIWFSLLCILLGLLYASVLYFRNKHHEIKKSIVRLLFIFRLVVITLISFLLLSPLLKIVTNTEEEPLIIIAHDNSQSIAFGKDSVFNKKSFPQSLEKLSEELKEDYDVQEFSFGEKTVEGISFDYKEKATDFSKLFDEINARYINRNVGAVIIASDGIINYGSNPVYTNSRQKYPLYTIALGDTTVAKDIKISKVHFNRTCFLGNRFPIEVVVVAEKCKDETVQLVVKKNQQTVFSKTLTIGSDKYIENILLEQEAQKAGIEHFSIQISRINNEINYLNNYADIYIDVIDGKEKILILAGAPHPDVAAIKQSLESKTIYQVDEITVDNFKGALNQYNVIILHQVPSKGKNHAQLLNNISGLNVPVIYILGAASDFNIFNIQKSGLMIKQQSQKFDEVTPVQAGDFNLFTISDDLKNTVAKLPAIYVPFGDYLLSNSAQVLFFQRLGSVATSKPLMLFNTEANPKTAVLAGEGIWRWKLHNYLYNGNHNAFNEIIHKTVQYLSVKADKSPFRIIHQNNFAENQNLEFDAEVYNESFELVNNEDIEMTIFDENNKKYSYTFSKNGKAYYLNAGNFPVGNYKYQAKVNAKNKQLQKSGSFVVSQVYLESLNLTANHQFLNTLAEKSGGKMLYPSQISEIPELIKSREDVKPVTYSVKHFTDFVNFIWFLILIILLLSAEWLIRKISGSY